MVYIKGKFIRENVSSLKPISIFIVIGHWESILYGMFALAYKTVFGLMES